MNNTVQNIFLECRGVRIRYEYGSGLYATARGYCPISVTGFYSCPSIEVCSDTDTRRLITLMDNHAAETDRERTASIRRCKTTLTKRPREMPWLEFITLSSAARNAFQLGIFATDADRATLWQLAHRLYETTLDKPAAALPTCRFFKMRFPACNIEKEILAPTRLEFGLLKKFMRGEVPSLADFGERMGPLGIITYNELPPRPNGEPIIEPPPVALDLSLGTDATPDEDEIETDGTPAPAPRRKPENPRREVGITPAPATADARQMELF